MASSEEEDYMSMPIPEEPSKAYETSVQRRKRKEREAEARSRPKPQAERQAEALAARSTALETSLPPTSKGFQLLSKLGYKAGQTLGAADNKYAITEPVGLDVKEDRGGIGLDSEKKRKIREAADHEAKRVKATEGDYRERVAKEREERRLEGLLRGAMGVAEGLDEESNGVEESNSVERSPNEAHLNKSVVESRRDEDGSGVTDREGAVNGKSQDNVKDNANSLNANQAESKHDRADPHNGDAISDGGPQPATHSHPAAQTHSTTNQKQKQKTKQKPNLLYRTLVHERAQKEREKRMRHELMASLSRNTTYDDPEEDAQDRLAFGSEEAELDEEDAELDAFNSQDVAERLARVVAYLREEYWYCFWCKFRYPTQNMEGCPGVEEEDHD